MTALLPVSVRVADVADAREQSRIDAFVADHPQGSLFHRPHWGRMVEAGCGQKALTLVAERAGTITGTLPLTAIRSRLFGNALVSSGFATGGGVLADGDATARRLLDAAWAIAGRSGLKRLELRGGPFGEEFTPQSGTYAAFSRALPATEDALLPSIPRKARAEVRRALGLELETSAGSDARHLDLHFRVYGESVRNLGTPVFPKRLFEAALSLFAKEADVVAVWEKGRPAASMLTFYHKGRAMPFWGGGTRAARLCRANDLVYYEVMRRAIGRGCTIADFGRSKVGTGPWHRKRLWAFEEQPLTYGVRLAAGEEARETNPASPRYRLQVAAWQRLPLWIANRVGPAIARGLG